VVVEDFVDAVPVIIILMPIINKLTRWTASIPCT